MPRIWTKLGGNSSYKPPGASCIAQGPQKQPDIFKNQLCMLRQNPKFPLLNLGDFWLFLRSLSCIGSSGRLVGRISPKFRSNPRQQVWNVFGSLSDLVWDLFETVWECVERCLVLFGTAVALIWYMFGTYWEHIRNLFGTV